MSTFESELVSSQLSSPPEHGLFDISLDGLGESHCPTEGLGERAIVSTGGTW